MINKFLFWLSGKLPLRKINLDSGPYLERYFLGQLFGITFYLHRFVSSDSERHVHNHPWGWGGSLILSGSYIEERAIDLCPHATPAGCWTRHRKVRWFNRVNCNTIHRIHDAKPGTWSLFFHGPRVRVGGERKGWGFFRAVHADFSGAPDGPGGSVSYTRFEPFPHSYGNWWETAPIGAEAGRVPL